MGSFHKCFPPLPALALNLAILAELSNLHAYSSDALAPEERRMGNRLVSLAGWMLLILNSS
jgi:hypothetical protein